MKIYLREKPKRHSVYKYRMKTEGFVFNFETNNGYVFEIIAGVWWYKRTVSYVGKLDSLIKQWCCSDLVTLSEPPSISQVGLWNEPFHYNTIKRIVNESLFGPAQTT